YRRGNKPTPLGMGKANPLFWVGLCQYQTERREDFRGIERVGGCGGGGGEQHKYLGGFCGGWLVRVNPYLMIFYYIFWVGLRVYRKSEGFEREFALVFLLVLISYIIGGNFSDYRTAPFINTVLYLLFGTIAGIEVHMALPTRRLREEPS